MKRQIVLVVLAVFLAASAYAWSPEAQNLLYLLLLNGSTATAQKVQVAIDAGADVNFKGGYLGLAVVDNCNPGVIVALIRAGAKDVNARNQPPRFENDWTVLVQAIMYDRYPAVIKALLDAGADVNALVDDGYDSPLNLATELARDPEIIRLLLKAGADIEARDSDGMTPLMNAAAYYQWHDPAPYVTILLQAGANAKAAKSNDGKTALDYAKDDPQLVGTDAFRMLEQASQ